ncbi:MAG: tetratricopeptide repeat protein, partial [Patescibacteria group bacterium]|nr:tetratricopeptide repeat protein [Patescibacteria group bacterium]
MRGPCNHGQTPTGRGLNGLLGRLETWWNAGVRLALVAWLSLCWTQAVSAQLVPPRRGGEATPSADVQMYNDGVQLVEDGEYERAIAAFSKAIERNPTFAHAYSDRGLAQAML